MNATRAAALAACVTLLGAVTVLVAYGIAGGGDRPRASYVLPERGCVVEPEKALEDFGFVPCPEEFPASLETEYRAAWIGLGIAIFGSVLLLAVLALGRIARAYAYAALAFAAGVLVLVGLPILLGPVELDLVGGGPPPRPDDAFDEVARWLLVTGVLLVPVGAAVRALVPRLMGGTRLAA